MLAKFSGKVRKWFHFPDVADNIKLLFLAVVYVRKAKIAIYRINSVPFSYQGIERKVTLEHDLAKTNICRSNIQQGFEPLLVEFQNPSPSKVKYRWFKYSSCLFILVHFVFVLD